MTSNIARLISVSALAAVLTSAGLAQSLAPELKAKVDAQAKLLSGWSTDPTIVAAVKTFNTNPPAEAKEMTQEKWKGLSVLDPTVRALTRNPLGQYLKTKKSDQIAECFVSGADGTKVAFLNKTTSWNHKGKPKHDLPMSGKTYIGAVEVDESTGLQQVQIGIPVLDGGKPIGSIVVGFSVAKL